MYRLCRWACGSHGLCREKTTSGQVYDANDINRPEKMSISNVNKLITPLDRDGKPPVPISRLLHVCGSASTNGRVHSPHMSSCHRLLGCIALHSLCIEAGRSIAGWTWMNGNRPKTQQTDRRHVNRRLKARSHCVGWA